MEFVRESAVGWLTLVICLGSEGIIEICVAAVPVEQGECLGGPDVVQRHQMQAHLCGRNCQKCWWATNYHSAAFAIAEPADRFFGEAGGEDID